MEWIRYILVVGQKETGSGSLNVRDRETGRTTTVSLEDLVAGIMEQTAVMPTVGLNMPMLLSKRPQIMVLVRVVLPWHVASSCST